MSNTPASPLDLAFKEQLNQLNQFGEMMMNRINDRVDRLLERLTPTTQGNNPGAINATPLGGIEGQDGNQPPRQGNSWPYEATSSSAPVWTTAIARRRGGRTA